MRIVMRATEYRVYTTWIHNATQQLSFAFLLDRLYSNFKAYFWYPNKQTKKIEREIRNTRKQSVRDLKAKRIPLSYAFEYVSYQIQLKRKLNDQFINGRGETKKTESKWIGRK